MPALFKTGPTPARKALDRELTDFLGDMSPRPDVGGRCPCGGLFAARDCDGAVFHTLPICEDFRNMDADAYLAFLRVRYSD